MERSTIEVLLEEKLIELLKNSITFDSRSNRNKTYSLLGEASKKRSVEETNELIELIDKQIRSFEADSIKNYFKDNSSKYSSFKDEIDSFINTLDKKISSSMEDGKKDEVIKLKEFIDKDVEDTINEVKKSIESEYDPFTSNITSDFKGDYSKLTCDEIDGFIKNIDDKLAELEAEASALENKNQ